MTSVARTKNMVGTVIVIVELIHKMIPHKFLHFSLDGCDK